MSDRLALLGYAAPLAFAASLVVAAAAAQAAPTIAVTEFIIDPYGTDETAPEFVELFNYGPDAVDVTGFTMKDNASSVYTFPSHTIPSGGYAIAARDRNAFLARWLGGVDDARVLSASTPFVLNNSAPGDGLTLRDAGGNLIFSLGYTIGAGNAANPYRATFLAVDDFTVTDYGLPPQAGAAGIVRSGTDSTGTLGFEDNNVTADPFAYVSAATSAGAPVLLEYGSPLLGGYTAVPEPASLAAIGLLGALAARRRR